ncbi:hypothetical protein ACQR1W_16245 [Bradyrhizobium sp. HKCCYLS1011]|uniref:hypothetical protein n=1 Tax=Bradyrhizobium sp. HKCCYLS1011 TaxID=3420733 RepID=UPI003EBD27FB
MHGYVASESGRFIAIDGLIPINPLRQKSNFGRGSSLICPVQTSREKDFDFYFSEIVVV